MNDHEGVAPAEAEAGIVTSKVVAAIALMYGGFGPAPEALRGIRCTALGAAVYVLLNVTRRIVSPPLLFVPVVVMTPQTSEAPAVIAAAVYRFAEIRQSSEPWSGLCGYGR